MSALMRPTNDISCTGGLGALIGNVAKILRIHDIPHLNKLLSQTLGGWLLTTEEKTFQSSEPVPPHHVDSTQLVWSACITTT